MGETIGRKLYFTKNPGETPLGEEVRRLLLDPSVPMGALPELLLFMADRAEHFKRFLEPLLLAGETIICDRYLDSTLAYQGYAGGIDLGLIEALHTAVFADFRPDLTLWLDLDPALALARLPEAKDRAELRGLAFMERVRAGYASIYEQESDRLKRIDVQGKGSEDIQLEVQKEIAFLLTEQS